MTTPHSEVCVVVPQLSGGCRCGKSNRFTANTCVRVYAFYFVKMDAQRCQKSKTAFWRVLCCLSNRHHINHLETGRKAFHRRTPCTLAALRAKCCWPKQHPPYHHQGETAHIRKIYWNGLSSWPIVLGPQYDTESQTIFQTHGSGAA